MVDNTSILYNYIIFMFYYYVLNNPEVCKYDICVILWKLYKKFKSSTYHVDYASILYLW